MKYVIIEKTRATIALKELAESEVEMLVLVISDENTNDAEKQLGLINDEFWTSSKTVKEVNGDHKDSLVLPKEAIG